MFEAFEGGYKESCSVSCKVEKMEEKEGSSSMSTPTR